MYEYRMVQVPPAIVIKKESGEGEAAQYLQSVVSAQAAQGWEFYRVDEIGVKVQPGCLAMLLGQREQNKIYYVVSFRRPKQ